MDIRRVILIQPYRDGRLLGKARGAPYTLMRLASLIPDEIPVEIWDENLEPIKYDGIGPNDLIGITSMTFTIDRAAIIAREMRRRGATVVIGGTHATLMPEHCAEFADVVSVGEGYRTWVQIINDFANDTLKPLYRDEAWSSLQGVATITDRAMRIVNEHRDYWTPFMEITRGCPRDCDFCTAIRVSGRIMRHRPIDEVIDEIERRGIRRFGVTDDNFGLNFRTAPEYLEELFKRMEKLPLQSWNAQGEQIVANYPDLLKLARKAHLDKIFIGFESINPDNKSSLGGKTKAHAQQIREVVRKIHAAGVGVVGLFVTGFDHDTPESYQAMWEFLRDSELDGVSLTVLTPFPGTPFREQIVDEGRLLDVPWSYYDTAHITYRPKLMTVDEMHKHYSWLVRKVYSPWQIARRGLSSLRRYPITVSHRKAFGSFSTDYGFRKTYVDGYF
ncbi:MAG: B12-binding domain-containing radical SAM protein [Ardenticatenales bacterium]|nr:B12-binding domain-containing radical SAM protein [Ardenticatenales bacterium]